MFVFRKKILLFSEILKVQIWSEMMGNRFKNMRFHLARYACQLKENMAWMLYGVVQPPTWITAHVQGHQNGQTYWEGAGQYWGRKLGMVCEGSKISSCHSEYGRTRQAYVLLGDQVPNDRATNRDVVVQITITEVLLLQQEPRPAPSGASSTVEDRKTWKNTNY